MKTCCTCKQEKPREGFYKNASRRDGQSVQCKACHSRTIREWRLTHPGAAVDKDRIRRIKRKYALSANDVHLLEERQKGRCSICLRELGKNYHIDHDHTTGLVRGLLCRGCNLGLGFFQDSALLLQSALQYLI